MGFLSKFDPTTEEGLLNISTGGLYDVQKKPVDKLYGAISGENAADAAKEAADIQARAAIAQAEATKEATAMTIEAQKEALATQRADLAPFVQFGSSFMDPARQAIESSQTLFSDPTSIMQNPMFTALQEETRRQNLQNAAVGGRLGTGGTLAGLESAALRTGFDVLNQERQAQLQNAGFLSNLVGQGQSAAAGQGAAAIQTGQGISNSLMTGNQITGNLMTSAAAAQAAGTIGAANAQQQGIMNMLNLGATIYGARG